LLRGATLIRSRVLRWLVNLRGQAKRIITPIPHRLQLLQSFDSIFGTAVYPTSRPAGVR
jgi:hypothetical protein